eukprot:c23085_g1_i2 orf=385-1920(-)
MENSLPASSPPPTQSSSGWGWGRWGTSALSAFSDLQKVAAEAADEISKTALAAAKGVVELHNSGTTSGETQENDKAEYDIPVDVAIGNLEPESQEEKLRKIALEKLEAAGQDSILAQGLKAIDSSVENLASGAWQALGSAVQGSINIVQKLEHSAEHLAGTIKKQGSFSHRVGSLAPNLLESGKAFTAQGMKVLEFVGRETVDFITSETGMRIGDDKMLTTAEVEDDGNLMENVTFDHCFYIYGGPEHLEELDALSNHYTLLCNRARAKLPTDQKAFFDGIQKQLQHILILGPDKDGHVPDFGKGKRAELGVLGNEIEMKALRESSVSKAAEMATGFTMTLTGLAMNERVQKAVDRLEAIRAEGIHRLSELCALGVSHLLSLGKSLLANSHQAEESVTAIDWPADCIERAKLIRARAQAIANDIEAISDSFITGIGDVTATFQATVKSETMVANEGNGEDARHKLIRETSIEDKAHAITSDLQHGGSTAIEKVQDVLQHLTFVVLSTSMTD